MTETDPQFQPNFFNHDFDDSEFNMGGPFLNHGAGKSKDNWVYDTKLSRYKLDNKTDSEETMDQNFGDKTFTNVTEDVSLLGIPLSGKALEEYEKMISDMDVDSIQNLGSSDTPQDPSDTPGYTDGQYEVLVELHGVDVADAWFAIDTEMAMLDGKDDINSNLISDMFNLTSEEGQVKVFKNLYDQLSPRARDKIANQGI